MDVASGLIVAIPSIFFSLQRNRFNRLAVDCQDVSELLDASYEAEQC